jgi:hypothetical protein
MLAQEMRGAETRYVERQEDDRDVLDRERHQRFHSSLSMLARPFLGPRRRRHVHTDNTLLPVILSGG